MKKNILRTKLILAAVVAMTSIQSAISAEEDDAIVAEKRKNTEKKCNYSGRQASLDPVNDGFSIISDRV